MFLRTLLAAFAVALCLPGWAEVERTAIAGGDGIELFWWPKLPPLDGWDQDQVASLQYGANVLAPRGKTFADSESAIYAKALYKPRVPQMHSLSELIDSNRKDFSENNGGTRVKDATRLTSANGRPVVCLIVEPTSPGNWEKVCYLEEGDYFLLFTLIAQSRSNFDSSVKAFEALISRYRQ
jgi:hypothetical protein